MSSSSAKGSTLKQDPIETQKPKASTYTAVEVSAPGQLRLVERRVPDPEAGQLRIRVEACGICHTDMLTVTGTYPGLTLPRVPGHEVVAALKPWGAGCRDRRSVNEWVSAGSLARMGCANRAGVETL